MSLHQLPRLQPLARAFSTTARPLSAAVATAPKKRARAPPPRSKPRAVTKPPAAIPEESTIAATVAVPNSGALTKQLFELTAGDIAINAPSSTHPAPFSKPIRDDSQPRYEHWIQIGKTYYTFYKTGVKNTWRNLRLSNNPEWPKHTPKSATGLWKMRNAYKNHPSICSGDKADLSLAHLPVPRLPSRAELLLQLRATRDKKRLPLFGLILLCFGELTPLPVALLGSGVVPIPCILPRQTRGERYSAAVRRATALHTIDEEAISLLKAEILNDTTKLREGLGELTQIQVGKLYSLMQADGRRHWKYWLGKGFAIQSVMDRIEELRNDGALILEGGAIREVVSVAGVPLEPLSAGFASGASGMSGVDMISIPRPEAAKSEAVLLRNAVLNLNSTELHYACEERGIDTIHPSTGKDMAETELRSHLGQWLATVVLNWDEKKWVQWQI